MPFGARCGAGSTRFRLWAPACERVRLVLGREQAREMPMASQEGGWHALEVEGVGAGEAYAFRIDDGPPIPDPASRFNPWDVNGASLVVDPEAYEWRDSEWRGRPWREAVVYELHVGTFTFEGTYLAAIAKLDHLVRLGITAIELLPLADFSGTRNWGYDGVLPFAPDASYGRPEELKRLVDEAHQRGLMVLLDVVYNHFGPEGNHLSRYAPQFFNAAHQTPWGAAINFDGEACGTVRSFFLHNALYWIEEYHFDGLRMDAIHAIADDSPKHIVVEIAEAIAAGPGRERPVHQVLENEANRASLLERGRPNPTAQWNDDAHHAWHVLATGETDGYYKDYADRTAWRLARTLAEGFGYQGEPSTVKGGERRGEPSTHLPPEAFVQFLQNHDHVGNRALGERLNALARPQALRLAAASLCLAPQIPLFFMGEEFGATTPFLFFCDFHGELADAVREGRRREFAGFERFRDAKAREAIPDPNAQETFAASRLDWACVGEKPHSDWLEFHRALLALRALEIVPRLGDKPLQGRFEVAGRCGVSVAWTLADGARLHLRASFGDESAPLAVAPGRVIHREGEPPRADSMPPWSGAWTLEAR